MLAHARQCAARLRKLVELHWSLIARLEDAMLCGEAIRLLDLSFVIDLRHGKVNAFAVPQTLAPAPATYQLRPQIRHTRLRTTPREYIC